MDEGQLNSFLDFLGRSHLFSDQGCTGLIISEHGSFAAEGALAEFLEKEIAMRHIDYSSDADDLSIFDLLWGAFQSGQWVLLNLRASPSRDLLKQLRIINSSHSMKLTGHSANGTGLSKLPGESGLIVHARRSIIEGLAHYRDFYALFGPIVCV